MKFSPFAATAAAAFAIAGNIISTSEAAVYDEREFGPYYPYQPSHYGPAAACVFQPEAQLTLFECITPGTAICRDGWTFGIEGHNEGYVKLWDPKGVDVYAEFPGAKKLCIGERSGDHPYSWYHEETPFLYVLYDHGHSQAWLHCAGVGKEDKDALLKIVNMDDDEHHIYPFNRDPVVKFRKGPGYSNALWWIDAMGKQYQDPGCRWHYDSDKPKPPTLRPTKYHRTKAPHSNKPTKAPHSRHPTKYPTPAPTPYPSVSLHPSEHPSVGPSAMPSESYEPSAKPSAIPSALPSQSWRPSTMPSQAPSAGPSVSAPPTPCYCPCFTSYELDKLYVNYDKPCGPSEYGDYSIIYFTEKDKYACSGYGCDKKKDNVSKPSCVFGKGKDSFKYIDYMQDECCRELIYAACYGL
mmetsp:Transcript_1690/g.3707  ORF Transcript_1690/g.3707 Transcript_1690/m.3707 type:complete len:409 (-) Transcript_1690:1930-3156(-)